MAGARELWLILRARSEGTAALKRFSNDLKVIAGMRGTVDQQRLALQNKIAAQEMRIGSIENEFGQKNLAIRRQQMQLENAVAANAAKANAVERQRIGIVESANRLLTQEMKLQMGILDIEDRAFALETQRLRIQQQMGVTQASIASLSPGGVGKEQALLSQARARTNQMQAELNRDLANDRARALRRAGYTDDSVVMQRQAQRQAIARRRVDEAGRAYAIASQKVGLINAEIRKLNSTLAIQDRQLTENAAKIARLDEEESILKKQLADLTIGWERLSAAERAAAGAEARHAEELGVLNARLEENRAAAMAAGATAGRLRTEMTANQASLAEMGSASEAAWERSGQALRSFGHTMQITGGISLAIMGAMAHSAAQLNKEITLAATQARPAGAGPQATAAIAQRLESGMGGVLDQMKQFPASSKDMANSLYEIFSGTNVQNVRQATDMLHTFNMMAVAGGTDLKTMTDAGISMYNNFPGQFKNMTDAANQFFAVVRYGRMNATQFAQSLSYILPIAKTAGLSFQDVGQAMAFLTRQTGAARTTSDAQGLARLIQLFARPEMAAGMKKLGVEVFDASGRMRPILRIMEDLRSKTNLTDKQISMFFKTTSKLGGSPSGFQGTIQAVRIFDQLYQHTRQARTVANQVARDTNEMVKSFNAMSRTPGVRWAVFVNQMRALALEIGKDLIPVFARMGAVIARVASAWESLSPHTRKIIAQYTAWGALLVLLAGTLAAVGGAVIGTILVFRRLGGMIDTLLGAFTKLKGGKAVGMEGVVAESGFITARFGLIAGSIATIIALLPVLHHHFGKITSTLLPLHEIIVLVNTALAIMAVRMIAARMAAIGLGGEMAVMVAGLGAPEILAAAITGLVAYKTADYLGQITGAKKAFRGFGDWLAKQTAPKISAVPSQDQAQKDIAAVKRYYNHLVAIGVDYAKRWPAIQLHFKKINESDLKIYFTAAQKAAEKAAPHDLPLTGKITPEFESTTHAERRLNHWKRTYNSFKTTAVQMERELVRLQAQFNVAPSNRLAQQIDTLQSKIKKLPQSTQEYIAQLAKTWGDFKLISDRQALSMARNVDRLRRAFERAPSVAGWQRWYAANKQYTQLATQDQQQFANDMVQMNQQATQKIQQQFQNTLQFIRGLYQQFFSQLQSQFGQLTQGPVAQSLQNQVQAIRDAGSKKAQALRDQADAIENSASNAEKKISATEGNLIDWGLRLDTSKLAEADAKARAKALRDKADAIEKAANARADRLEKRLAAHKLTPKELYADLRAQVMAFEQWQRDLGALARKGAPQELINQLSALGPEYEPVVKALLSMNKRQFHSYTEMFNRGQRDIQRAALRQTRAQLREYRKYGRDIPKAIAAGIQDEAPSVTKALRNMAHGLFRRSHITVRHGRIQMDLHARPLENATTRSARNAGRNATAVGHNTRQLQTHGRRLQNSSNHVRRNTTELQRNTRALQDNTAQLQKRPQHTRPHTRHPAHTDPRRHQNPTAHYHYHADRSHHMSADQYFRKMHFLHRNQRRC